MAKNLVHANGREFDLFARLSLAHDAWLVNDQYYYRYPGRGRGAEES